MIHAPRWSSDGVIHQTHDISRAGKRGVYGYSQGARTIPDRRRLQSRLQQRRARHWDLSMPRRSSHPPVAPEDLLGPAEVLALVGWRTHKSITDAESHNDFPPPVRVLQGTRIWDRSDVLAWLKLEGRTPQSSANR